MSIANLGRTCLLSFLLSGFALAQDEFPGLIDDEENDTDAQRRPTIGLVLSGGGARGAAHVGVLRIIDELHIPVDYIAGTSMGAIVGGLYASGMSAEELEDVIEAADWSALLSDRPPRAERSFRRKSDDYGFLVDFEMGVDKTGLVFPEGIVQGQNLEMALKRLAFPAISIDNFDRLPIPFRAVATDIVSGEAVILGSGDLATAIRASMSVPGLIKPVRLEGRVLVDGGVANNLPVQIVKDMGAEVLIVVDVGFPLQPESQLKSALDVTKQMITILINARTKEQLALLGSSDVLISPDLGDLGSQDFQRSSEAVQLGKDKAREYWASLARLSVSDEAYLAYRKALKPGSASSPVIDRVVIETESKLSPKVIEARLTDPRGSPLDIDQLDSDIADIYGLDTFETFSYDVSEEPEGTTLTVQSTQKSWGPNYLQFGINLEDDFNGESNYNVAARFTKTEINGKGGEFRAEVQIGQLPRLFAEFYQPLDYASRWFVNPQIGAGSTSTGLFYEDRQVALFRSNALFASLEGGYNLGNWGELRAGLVRAHGKNDIQIGPPDFEEESVDLTTLIARFSYDTIDRIAVPRSGTNITLNWNGTRESLGSDYTFDLAQGFLLKPQTWGKNTLLHWWEYGTTFNDQSPGNQPYALGGLFNLTGYAPNELTGKYYGMGRLLYYHRMGDQALSILNTSIYLGASLEIGNVWQNTSDISLSNTLTAGSVFVIFDTLLGPLYLAYGAAEGGHQSGYLFLGQTF
ncbi:MAG: patatin [Gammaproteobacteria bacterium]|nr:patatin [Gammaproteobacteria bacterium]